MQTLEIAHIDELNICNAIINDGRDFQKEQGFIQWTDDYPNIDIIKDDIQKEKGYVIKIDGQIVGYMCVDFEGEPAYDNIKGEWQTKIPYAVVHRMAFSKGVRGTGLTRTTFALIEELCYKNGIKSIRVDTDFSNKRMQHILLKYGFIKCGIIVFQGKGRLAYDKSLS